MKEIKARLIINLTPHDVNIIGENNKIIKTFPKSEIPARCTVTRKQIGNINGISLYETEFGEVEHLPHPVKGYYYIVSRVVAEATLRSDLLIPDEIIRDEDGKIIGCKGFTQITL